MPVPIEENVDEREPVREGRDGLNAAMREHIEQAAANIHIGPMPTGSSGLAQTVTPGDVVRVSAGDIAATFSDDPMGGGGAAPRPVMAEGSEVEVYINDHPLSQPEDFVVGTEYILLHEDLDTGDRVRVEYTDADGVSQRYVAVANQDQDRILIPFDTQPRADSFRIILRRRNGWELTIDRPTGDDDSGHVMYNNPDVLGESLRFIESREYDRGFEIYNEG